MHVYVLVCMYVNINMRTKENLLNQQLVFKSRIEHFTRKERKVCGATNKGTTFTLLLNFVGNRDSSISIETELRARRQEEWMFDFWYRHPDRLLDQPSLLFWGTQRPQREDH
jgi:hypothetical protein